MADAFHLARDIAAVEDGRAACWAFIEAYAATWFRPLTPADGYGDDELADAEDRLGVRLPPSVCEAYQLFGRRADLVRKQDPLLEPAELRFDEIGEVLTFRVENQWVTEWGIRASDFDAPHPPVIFWLDELDQSGWRPFLDRFSLACVEMALSESMLHRDISGNRELDDETVDILEQRFERLRFPDYPLWANPDGPPTRWFGDAEVLLRDDSRSWL